MKANFNVKFAPANICATQSVARTYFNLLTHGVKSSHCTSKSVRLVNRSDRKLFCFQLYWSLQGNGLPVPALPNGPSSLSAEETACLDEQRRRDLAASLQNLPGGYSDAPLAAVAAVAPLPDTELSLTPDNTFEFTVDADVPTMRTNSDSPTQNTQAQTNAWVTQHMAVNDHVVNLQQQQHHHVGYPMYFGQQKDNDGPGHMEYHSQQKPPTPPSVAPQPVTEIPTDLPHGYHDSQVVTVVDRSDSAASSVCSTNTSQKLRRNKKRRPPNYYEEKDKANNKTNNVVSENCVDMTHPKVPEDKHGVHQEPVDIHLHKAHDTANNNVHVDVRPVQPLSYPNVPMEMFRQVQLVAQQQLYHQPHLLQQQQQHQQAMSALSSLIQQGNLPLYQHRQVQMPPPHMLHHMPPLHDPRLPPPPPPTVQVPMPPAVHQQIDHAAAATARVQPPQHHMQPPNMAAQPPHRRSVERQFHPSRPLESAAADTGRRSHAGSEEPRNVDAPRTPELPPVNHQIPHVPPTQPTQQFPKLETTPPIDAQTAEKKRREEEQKRLQEKLDKVTADFEALQSKNAIAQSQRQPSAEKTVHVEKRIVEEEKPMPSQTEDIVPSEDTQDRTKPADSDVQSDSNGQVGCVSQTETVLSKEKTEDEAERVKLESRGGQAAGSRPSPSTAAANRGAAAGQPPPPPPPTAPPKAAGAWGWKSAWADLFKDTDTAARSVVIYSDSAQQSVGGAVDAGAKAAGSEGGSKEVTPEKTVPAAEDKAIKELGGKLNHGILMELDYSILMGTGVNKSVFCKALFSCVKILSRLTVEIVCKEAKTFNLALYSCAQVNVGIVDCRYPAEARGAASREFGAAARPHQPRKLVLRQRCILDNNYHFAKLLSQICMV